MSRVRMVLCVSVCVAVGLVGIANLSAEELLESPEDAGWELVFEDDFEREELGDKWEIHEGSWEIVDGDLRGSGTIVSAVPLPEDGPLSYQRMEFHAVTDVEVIQLIPGMDVEPEIGDVSSFINSKSIETSETARPTRTGYFFQFGGYYNTRNRIVRAGSTLVDDQDTENQIVADQMHHVVVENDEGHLRFFVDGELWYEYEEGRSVLEEEQNRVGFYFYTRARISDVKVYAKPYSE